MDSVESDNLEQPSKAWYVGYVFLGSIIGLICYYNWKDKNPIAAGKHLAHSVLISFAVMVIPIIILTLGVGINNLSSINP